MRRTTVEDAYDFMNLNTLCDSAYIHKSLYINKIQAVFHLDDEDYDARISLYYIPDSVIYFTAVNSGFEIIRGAVYKDSTMIINRLEKTVFIQKYNGFGYKPLVEFTDLEILFNRSLLCESIGNLTKEEDQIIADFSSQNINKKITYSADSLTLNKFEFFQKKTGEYIVGNINNQGIVTILSNYIMDDLEIRAEGGNVEFDKKLSINLSLNRAKYTYFYL